MSKDHIGRDNANIACKTVLEEGHRLRPPLCKELFKYVRRKLRPDVAWAIPVVLLEDCSKVVVLEPEDVEQRMIFFAVLNETNPSQVFVVQPVDRRMCVSRISRAAVDLSTVHIPQV
jgi:hypothetical protein